MNPQNPIFAKFDQALGKTTPTKTLGTPTSRADEIRNLAKATTPVTEEDPAIAVGKGLISDFSDRGKEQIDIANTATSKYNQGLQQMKQSHTLGGDVKGLATSAGGLLEGGLQTAGNVAKGVGDILGAGIKLIPGLNHIIEKGGQSFLEGKNIFGQTNGETIQKISAIAEKHPELAKNLSSVVNILSLGVGAEAEQPVKEAIGSTVKGAIEKTPQLLGNIKSTVGGKLVKQSESKALKAISIPEELMTTSMRKEAINEGRQQATKLGGVKYTPSATEKHASTILDGKLTGNAAKDVPIVKNEIATRGAEVEKYLSKNSQKISAQEQTDMFKKFKDVASKDMTPTEMKAYDEQMKLFLKQLPGRGGYNTPNFYKGLKEYESNIADHMARGKAALLDPTGVASAKIRAASDIRKVVRDMIGDKHPEFKSRMFDLASLYDAKDNIITKAANIKGNAVTRFAKKHPVITGIAAGEAGRKIITGGY